MNTLTFNRFLLSVAVWALPISSASGIDPDDIGRVIESQSPYRSCPPWGRMIHGVPVFVFGYPPYYGPPSRADDQYQQTWYGRPRTYWPSSYPGVPLHEVARRIDPNIVTPYPSNTPQPATAQREEIDLGIDALRRREYLRAVIVYERRAEERLDLEQAADTKQPRIDRTALRLLGIALLGARRTPEAERAIIDAYAQDPDLEGRGFDPANVLGSSVEFRRLANRAVAYAHKSGTPSAWTMVAHLMAMEGRHEVAARMLERAQKTRPTTSARTAAASPAPEPTPRPENEPASFRLTPTGTQDPAKQAPPQTPAPRPGQSE